MSGFDQYHPYKSGIIRVGPECYQYGDPWTWCVNYKDEGNGCVFLYGAVRMPSGDEQGWLIDVLLDMGFQLCRWERIKGNLSRTTRYFKVNRWKLSEVFNTGNNTWKADKIINSKDRFYYSAKTADWCG